LLRLARNFGLVVVSVWFASAASETPETKVQGVLIDKAIEGLIIRNPF
jgi:hypothetical protein